MITEDRDYIMYYLGQTKGLYGVGFLVKKKYKENIKRFIGVSERVCALEIVLENVLLAIIQAYAPTESSSQDDIDKFYDDLAKAHDTISTNFVISMGDYNAQIGIPKDHEHAVMGKYGYGRRSIRGERLIQYAQEYNLKIINTMFKSKPKNRWTWISPDKNTKNEIDYIMSTKHQLFTNYKVLTSFPFGSDHRLLRASIHLRPENKCRRKFSNTTKNLKTAEEQKTYLENLSRHIPELLTTHENYKAESYCQKIVDSILSSLKTTKEKQKSILSKEALRLMRERSQLQNKTKLNETEKEKLKELYKNTNREIRRCYDTHRLNTIQRHLDNSRSVTKAYKELNKTKSWIPSLQPGSTKSMSRLEIINIATEFYAKLYSQPVQQNQSLSSTNQPEEASTTPEFTEPEIQKQILKLKPEKCPGPDLITNECIKYAATLLLTPITILWNKILHEETVPHIWTESEIILLYKKGDPADISNYRPISLMPCLYKLFAACLLNRISPDIDKHQPIEQAGFRSSFSTIDHIHVVDQVIEKYLEFRRPLYVAFIDYKKAFDSISHNGIWEALRSQNINEKYINILKNIYKSSTSRVKLDRVGNRIRINRGVRQGDPISPKLFIAVLQHIMKDLPWANQGINIEGHFLSHLRFADDIILFSESPRQLNIMINDLQQVSTKVGLEMNLDKTKVMTNRQRIPITVNNIPIEYVDKYIYLGKQISFSKERNTEEVDRRVASTWKNYWAHKVVFKSRLPLSAKKIVMDSVILPCLTYGCQTWSYDVKTRNKIQTTQRRLERSYLGIKLKDKIRNSVIRKRTNLSDALTFSLQRKWRWAGHVARYDENRWPLRVQKWMGPRGSRARGRPNTRWADDIVKTAGRGWLETAKDKEKWKSLEEAFTQRGSILD
ncbi:hypothetical protein B5X24_HaOG203818 [Helicoverpa armigera]|nr:hypothetical protein B5X24_HaOG203818 [Helicoverpa armigera]